MRALVALAVDRCIQSSFCLLLASGSSAIHIQLQQMAFSFHQCASLSRDDTQNIQNMHSGHRWQFIRLWLGRCH